MYRILFGHRFSVLLGTYLGMELLGHLVMFNVLRNCQVIFQSSCIILHFHQQCMSVPISRYPF